MYTLNGYVKVNPRPAMVASDWQPPFMWDIKDTDGSMVATVYSLDTAKRICAFLNEGK